MFLQPYLPYDLLIPNFVAGAGKSILWYAVFVLIL
jgi:hypothetical protein